MRIGVRIPGLRRNYDRMMEASEARGYARGFWHGLLVGLLFGLGGLAFVVVIALSHTLR